MSVRAALVDPPDPAAQRKQAAQLLSDGNWKDALNLYRQLVTNPDNDRKLVGDDLVRAVQCLNQLGTHDEIDELIEQAINVHQDNWRLLQTAAEQYRHVNHWGFIVAGKFERGGRRGQGQPASALERDRVRSLQLYDQARKIVLAEPGQPGQAPRLHEAGATQIEASRLLTSYAEAIRLGTIGQAEAWRLQILTDLAALPDYEETQWWGWRGGSNSQGAPVDADGNPVFHTVPESFDTSASDGQRWRWLLAQAEQLRPDRHAELTRLHADFLWNQFGVQTLAQQHGLFARLQSGPASESDTEQNESSTWP